MVQLPSGRSVGISIGHILEPGTQWFPCPEGHFWHQVPDLAINAPPFGADQDVLCDFVDSPCPTTVAEAARFVRVIEFLSEKQFYWPGLTLDASDRPDGWSDEDCAAWLAWKTTPAVQAFLERVIEVCRAQAEANRTNRGGVVVRRQQADVPPTLSAAKGRAVAIVRESFDLETAADACRTSRNEAEGLRIFERLKALRAEVEHMLADPGRRSTEGWHARGILARLLHLPEEAEQAFVEVTRQAPFALDGWLELTRIRAEQGKLVEAETAARRAVTLGKDNAAAWANLGAVLVERNRLDEAREVVDRALAIDPQDVVAKNLVASLQSRTGR